MSGESLCPSTEVYGARKGLMGRDVGGFVVVNDSVAFGLGLVQRWRWGGSETAVGGGSLVWFFSWELYVRSGCNWDVRFVRFSQSLTSGLWPPPPTPPRVALSSCALRIKFTWFGFDMDAQTKQAIRYYHQKAGGGGGRRIRGKTLHRKGKREGWGG